MTKWTVLLFAALGLCLTVSAQDTTAPPQTPAATEASGGREPTVRELPLQARSREVSFDGTDLEVLVPVAQATSGFATVVALPETGIKSVLVHANEEDLSLEHVEGRLFLKLLKKSEGYVDAIGASGTLYRIRIQPVTGGVFDSTVRVKSGVLAGLKTPRADGRPKVPEALQLIRAMRLGEGLEGAAISRSDTVVLKTQTSEAQVVYVYDTPTLTGYIVRLGNTSSDALRVNLPSFAGPGLVASATREFVVPPGKHTYLYFVFAR